MVAPPPLHPKPHQTKYYNIGLGYQFSLSVFEGCIPRVVAVKSYGPLKIIQRPYYEN